jgi:hypothetical protein
LATGKKIAPAFLEVVHEGKWRKSGKHELLEEGRCVVHFPGLLNLIENLTKLAFKTQDPKRHCDPEVSGS